MSVEAGMEPRQGCTDCEKRWSKRKVVRLEKEESGREKEGFRLGGCKPSFLFCAI